MTDDELRVLWRALDGEGWPFGDAFKLLLLTGQRRDEVTGMRWREVNLDAQTWTIAKDRCKNGKAHTIDLCPEALRLIGARYARRWRYTGEDRRPLVYTTTGQTPVSGYSRAKSRIDRKMKAELGDRFQPWRLHDLRRTAASGMAALGFQPHVIERVLNHVSGAQGGLVGVYQRHEYRDDRKRAILAWGEHVMSLVGALTSSRRMSCRCVWPKPCFLRVRDGCAPVVKSSWYFGLVSNNEGFCFYRLSQSRGKAYGPSRQGASRL